VAQLVSPGRPRPSGSVTVADLVSRNAPVPVRILGSEPAPAVPVGSLLRREGRAPGAEPDGNEGPRSTVRGAVVRGATIVAGTALVAGSAFGGAVLVETFLLDPEPAARTAPAANAPDETPAATSGALVDRAAAGPDAGTGAPTAWTEVAFPTAPETVVGGRAATPPGTASPSAASPARSSPAASSADHEESDQEGTSTEESTEQEPATPATSASTAGSTSDEPAPSSGGTAEQESGLIGTVVDTAQGLLGLG
jgi:hypothetical protein